MCLLLGSKQQTSMPGAVSGRGTHDKDLRVVSGSQELSLGKWEVRKQGPQPYNHRELNSADTLIELEGEPEPQMRS